MIFTQTRNKSGRPKKAACNSVLQEKRLGVEESSQLTGLFLLWARKQVTQMQFIAGCYYEDLANRVNHSMGTLNRPSTSLVAKVHQIHLGEVTNRLAQFRMNEVGILRLQELDRIIECVHVQALSVVRRVLLSTPLESAQIVQKLNFQDLAIFKRSMQVIDQYLENVSAAASAEDMAVA